MIIDYIYIHVNMNASHNDIYVLKYYVAMVTAGLYNICTCVYVATVLFPVPVSYLRRLLMNGLRSTHYVHVCEYVKMYMYVYTYLAD